MPALNTRRTYADGSILFKADLDNIVDDIETLLNITKLNDDNIQDQGITASNKLLDASISTGKLASSAVTTAKIADDSITLAKMADNSVGTVEIVDNSITLAKMTDNSVSTAEIVDNSITLAKMADGSVGTAELVDASVTTAKLVDASVTQGKLAAVPAVASGGTGTLSWGSATETIFNPLTSVISTNGRPVVIMLTPETSGNSAFIQNAVLSLRRDGSVIGRCIVSGQVGSLLFTDQPPTGGHTYTVFAGSADGGANPVLIYYMRLVAYEL